MSSERLQAALLGIIAILFQALLPAVHHPASFFAPDGQENAAYLASVDLCLPDDLHGHQAPGSGQADCPVCQMLHALGHAAPPPPVSLTIASGYAVWEPYTESYTLVERTVEVAPAARPRAPPAASLRG